MLLCLPLYFFPSLPLTHPLAFHSPSNPRSEQKNLYAKQLWNTIFGVPLAARVAVEKSIANRRVPGSWRRPETKRFKKAHNAHGGGDDIRPVHHNVRIHLKVQLSPRETEADSLQVRPLKAEPKTWQCGAEYDKLSADVRKWPPWRGLTLWIWGTTCSSFLRSFEKCGLYSLCRTNGAHCVFVPARWCRQDLTEVWCYDNKWNVQPREISTAASSS